MTINQLNRKVEALEKRIEELEKLNANFISGETYAEMVLNSLPNYSSVIINKDENGKPFISASAIDADNGHGAKIDIYSAGVKINKGADGILSIGNIKEYPSSDDARTDGLTDDDIYKTGNHLMIL